MKASLSLLAGIVSASLSSIAVDGLVTTSTPCTAAGRLPTPQLGRGSAATTAPLRGRRWRQAAVGDSAEDDFDAFRTRSRLIAEQWPFVVDPDLVDPAVKLNSPACYQTDAESYLASSIIFREELPSRLRSFQLLDKTVLPPDGRVVRAKATIAFAAPLPLQILPGQRQRIQGANLELRSDGLLDVTVVLSSTIRLTKEGRIREEESFFADDPFAVMTTIARFELLFARFLVICGPRPNPIDYVSAYIAVLREITRLEMDEVARREQTDESRVILGETDGMSKENFDMFFIGFVARNFALGGGIGLLIYVLLRFPKLMAAMESAGSASGGFGL